MPMNRFVVWARLGNKSKVQLEQPIPRSPTSPSLPEPGQETDETAEATDSLDHHSADVGLPDDTLRSSGEDMVTPSKGEICGEYVTVPYSHNLRHSYPPYERPSDNSFFYYARISFSLMLISLFAFQIRI
jgi:hypothetical protein